MRSQEAISASKTACAGAISPTIRATDRQSETPLTSSPFPIRSSGPVPTGVADSTANGVSHTCIGCTRDGSSEVARNTTSVPSSNSE